MANANQTEQVWLRVGDADLYHSYDGIEDAADALWFAGVQGVDGWCNYGFEYENLSGDNRVSCYWGDEESTPTRNLTTEEREQLKQSLEAGCF